MKKTFKEELTITEKALKWKERKQEIARQKRAKAIKDIDRKTTSNTRVFGRKYP